MKAYFFTKQGAVDHVEDSLLSLKRGSALTTTITLEKSGAYSVYFVTDLSLEDTEQDSAVLSFLPTQVNT